MQKDAAASYQRMPLRFLIGLLAIVSVSEISVMFLLPVLFVSHTSWALEAVCDAGLLAIIISPAMWLLVVRPLRADANRLAQLNDELTYEIGTRLALEQRLTRQALHDSLTGLPNRAFFIRELERTLARQQRFTILFIDLNRFKPVNDSFGHAAGDQLLAAVARRLEGALRPSDLLARLGGDEFTVLLENVEEQGHAARVAQRILDRFSEPFSVEEPPAGGEVRQHLVHISASIGIAGSQRSYKRAEEVLRDADTAMYRAKSRGIGGFAIFDPALPAHVSGAPACPTRS